MIDIFGNWFHHCPKKMGFNKEVIIKGNDHCILCGEVKPVTVK